MLSQDDDSQRAALIVIFAVVALVVAAVVGSSVYRLRSAAMKTAPAVSTPRVVKRAPADTSPSALQAASDAASVKVENGVVKFYFASGKADLAAGAGGGLARGLKGAQAGPHPGVFRISYPPPGAPHKTPPA